MKAFVLFSLASLTLTMSAQPGIYTAADYERAEKFLAYNTTPLVYQSGVRLTWLADERFWYRVTTPDGSESVLMDTAKALVRRHAAR